MSGSPRPSRLGSPGARARLELAAAIAIEFCIFIALWTAAGREFGLPRLLEFALWCCFFAALGWRLGEVFSGKEPWLPAGLANAASLALGVHVWLEFRLSAWLSDETAFEIASRASALLSATWHGWPLWALAYAWALCALAWTASALFRESWSFGVSRWPHLSRVLGHLSWAWTLAFGTLALLGYATGSPWLVPE